MGSLLQKSLPVSTLVVAIDPGKVQNRIWLSRDDPELVVEPFSLPVLRSGLDQLDGLVRRHAPDGAAVFAIQATGGLHRAWVGDLNVRFPGCVRVFAPSETASARSTWDRAGSRPTTGTVSR